MDAKREGEPTAMNSRATVERKSERELVVMQPSTARRASCSRPRTKPELFVRWWVPNSSGGSLLSWELDSRVGCRYRLEFGHPGSEQPMAFFGSYIEVTPPSRLVWTNEESDDGALTTVTFEEKGDKTLLVLHELYPSKRALDAAIASGSTGGFSETFEQLDDLLATMGASVERS